jgi:radical SAM superfamily enzyme YgiQ (UPF0313 family)
VKILFVATRKNQDPADRELYEMDFMCDVLGFKRSLLDLGLVTVAACTPKHIEIEIVDEYLTPIPYDTDADLIAMSAKTSCVAHAYDVAGKFRAAGKPVVLGGIHASLRPDEALEHVDHVVLGEAEKTWPVFCDMFEKGNAPMKMDAAGFPPMAEIPPPAWDRLDGNDFLFHQIQTTRGCPFTCRFCSVPDISGQSFRFKPVEEVVAEIRALPVGKGIGGWLKNKMKAVYFVDDNFISRTRYTKKLLTALVPLYKSGELGEWSAETTLNVSRDEELLDLFAESGCSTLIIGFESISEATLEAMDKQVNFCLDYREAIERIHRRGMSIVGNFIVGFDTDNLQTFKDIIDFVDEHDILYPFFSILTPMPGTQLHEEYKRDDRLDHTDWAQYDTRHVVMKPHHMSREQLMDGYIWMYEQAYVEKRALDRMTRYWAKWRQRRSTMIENAFIKWRMKPHVAASTPRFQQFVRDGWERLNDPTVKSDVGQLLYYYDSAHFCDYMAQFKSANYAHNCQIFEGVVAADLGRDELSTKQWQNKRVTKKARDASENVAA